MGRRDAVGALKQAAERTEPSAPAAGVRRNFSPRLGMGGVLQAAEKRSTAVILIPPFRSPDSNRQSVEITRNPMMTRQHAHTYDSGLGRRDFLKFVPLGAASLGVLAHAQSAPSARKKRPSRPGMAALLKRRMIPFRLEPRRPARCFVMPPPRMECTGKGPI